MYIIYIYTQILHKAMTRAPHAPLPPGILEATSHLEPMIGPSMNPSESETSCPVAQLQRNVLGIRQFYKASTKTDSSAGIFRYGSSL